MQADTNSDKHHPWATALSSPAPHVPPGNRGPLCCYGQVKCSHILVSRRHVKAHLESGCGKKEHFCLHYVMQAGMSFSDAAISLFISATYFSLFISCMSPGSQGVQESLTWLQPWLWQHHHCHHHSNDSPDSSRGTMAMNQWSICSGHRGNVYQYTEQMQIILVLICHMLRLQMCSFIRWYILHLFIYTIIRNYEKWK